MLCLSYYTVFIVCVFSHVSLRLGFSLACIVVYSLFACAHVIFLRFSAAHVFSLRRLACLSFLDVIRTILYRVL